MTNAKESSDTASGAANITGPESGIGSRIEAARTKLGMTQIELHKRSGLARTVIAGYEKGRYIPGGREIRRLCDALNVSPNELIYGSESPFAAASASPLAALLNQENPTALATGVSLLLQGLDRRDRDAFLALIVALFEARRGPERAAAVAEILKGMVGAIIEREPEFMHLIEQQVEDPAFKSQMRKAARKLERADLSSKSKRRKPAR